MHKSNDPCVIPIKLVALFAADNVCYTKHCMDCDGDGHCKYGAYPGDDASIGAVWVLVDAAGTPHREGPVVHPLPHVVVQRGMAVRVSAVLQSKTDKQANIET